MPYTFIIKVTDLPVSLATFRQQALAWANDFPLVANYTSNGIPYPYHGFDELLAVSSGDALGLDQDNAFESLHQNLTNKPNLLCGFLAYDLKNQVEKLTSDNPDYIGFPQLLFFEPELYLYFEQDEIKVFSQDDKIQDTIQRILNTAVPDSLTLPTIQLQQRVSREEYIQQVERVRQYILEGEVYEMNYCMEFYAERVDLSPLPIYLALNSVSPTPFSGFLRYKDRYLMCASPERYLKKVAQKLISQPIKGTIRRGATPEEDLQLQQQLRHDEKELAENMMIVDLVRNDLRRSCATGTIQVEEMFGIYGFRQVSQMISTISGQLRPESGIADALSGSFPMGSMTGAPKIRAMEIIEELEATKRGLYSGAFGYIKPNQDFDFNVVIRSLQYNATTGYLSFMVGSAITYDSIPEKEYDECLLKARAIMQVLGL